MEEQSQLAERTLDQVADAVICTDHSGAIIRWNDALPISSCIESVSAMIEAYDHYFGEGTGEAFFYLDLLPDAVIKAAVKPE
jgi:hypothetical protein